MAQEGTPKILAERQDGLEEPKLFGAEIDPEAAELWDEFMAESPIPRAIYKIWESPHVTNPGFRQRLVTVLTAPDEHSLPYASSSDQLRNRLRSMEPHKSGFTQSLREKLDGRPELAQELAQGILYWLTRKGVSSLSAIPDASQDWEYREAIKELIPLLPEELADQLFSYIPTQNPDFYRVTDKSDARNPALYFLSDSKLPDRHKAVVLDNWVKIARQEIEKGRRTPALNRLKMLLESWAHKEDIDDETYTAVISFFETEACTEAGGTYVASNLVRRAAKHIKDPELHFKFALRHLMAIHAGEIIVTSEEDEAFVKQIKGEAESRGLMNDAAILEVLINDWARLQGKRALGLAEDEKRKARRASIVERITAL